jgi:hypothetical protein
VTTGAIIEVAIAALLLVGGIVAFRRGGSQGAVLLFAVAAILAVHGLGLLEYRPSAGELGQ